MARQVLLIKCQIGVKILCDLTEQEFSYFVESSDIGDQPVHIEVSMPDKVAKALCKRLGIHSIKELKADITLERNNLNKAIFVHGSIHAKICQKCVISTDPVHEIIDDEFEAWFTDRNQVLSFVKAKRERMSRKELKDQPIMEESDDPEVIIDGKIDLGELITQNLSLSLDEYPRLTGAEYDNKCGGDLKEAPEGTYDNPFAALKDWKAGEAKKDK